MVFDYVKNISLCFCNLMLHILFEGQLLSFTRYRMNVTTIARRFSLLKSTTNRVLFFSFFHIF